MDAENKNLIVILGGGESGVGAAILAKSKGFDVFLSDFGNIKDENKRTLDDYEIEYEEGKHSEDKIIKAKEVVKSPGISDSISIIKIIKSNNIPVISEIEFAGRYLEAHGFPLFLRE